MLQVYFQNPTYIDINHFTKPCAKPTLRYTVTVRSYSTSLTTLCKSAIKPRRQLLIMWVKKIKKSVESLRKIGYIRSSSSINHWKTTQMQQLANLTKLGTTFSSPVRQITHWHLETKQITLNNRGCLNHHHFFLRSPWTANELKKRSSSSNHLLNVSKDLTVLRNKSCHIPSKWSEKMMFLIS